MRHLHMPALIATMALLTASCATIEFDNPLDPKGTNYLWGYNVPLEIEREMISVGESGNSAQLWTNPELSYDRRPPGIRILGDNPARIRYNSADGAAQYKTMMGMFENHWLDAIDIDRGGRNTTVSVEITLSTSVHARDRHDYSGETPLPGRYHIVYTAAKPACAGSLTPESQVTRALIVE